MARDVKIELSDCRHHPQQREFIDCTAKRIIVRAGRRGGKTRGVSQRAAKRFLAGRRVLYAAPTQDQLDAFWHHIKTIFNPAIDAGMLVKNETRHSIEVPRSEQRIRAKTAWNADTLRGDYADDLILDEWQLMNEDAWGVVGAPMLLDNDGDVVFIYTPPSLHSRSYSKADDPQHAAKMYREAAADVSGRWQTFHWTSRQNGYISQAALGEICHDMTALAIRMEIDAEDIDEAPGALWHRDLLEKTRVKVVPGDLHRIVVGVDPSISSTGDAAGIVTCGIIGKSQTGHAYVLDDDTIQGSPHQWASRAIGAFRRWSADRIVAESNQGGLMVSQTICTIDPHVPVTLVHASRGKATRAEPIAAAYESGRVHHVGSFPAMEDEMVLWAPGDPKSPNRVDALTWSLTDLLLPENLLTGGRVKVVGY